VARRHRQNIGTIVEAARLRVKKMYGPNSGRILGEIEEYFAQGLTPGDTFLFAGEVLSFERVREMNLEARPSGSGVPKIPSYVGGQMPLSTYLADGVRAVLSSPDVWGRLPPLVREWLDLQARFSLIPDGSTLLIEHFPRHGMRHTVFYTFEGRRANQTLGMLITRRMERMGLKPISFVISDYGLAIAGLVQIGAEDVGAFLSPDILGDELEEWIADSPMLKRAFRQVATVAGLTEQSYAGERRSMKQVTFSTDLIYDVLRRHEPDHVLLQVTRREAEQELLDLQRLARMLTRFNGRWRLQDLRRPSPLSIPMLMQVRSDPVRGLGIEDLLLQGGLHDEAQQMMEEARASLGQS
jgi:ATP-dependent Lhr-like helicase